MKLPEVHSTFEYLITRLENRAKSPVDTLQKTDALCLRALRVQDERDEGTAVRQARVLRFQSRKLDLR